MTKSMVKSIIGLIMILAMGACAIPISQKYSFSLIEPVQQGIFVINEQTSIMDSTNNLQITISPGSEDIGLIIENKSNQTVKINWDEVLFIDPSGSTHRVIHKTTNFIDKNQPQPPSIIPAGSKLEDTIIPSENIYWGQNMLTGIHEWKYTRLFEGYEDQNISFEFRVYIPIEIQGKKVEYNFKIKANPLTQ